MQFKKLEKLKRKYKEYSNSIESFEAYLDELEKDNIRVIEPNIFSKRLNIPYPQAIHLLGLAVQDKILTRGYQVFSTGDVFSLGEYDSLSDIPETISNPATGQKVNRDNFFVDLVFHVNELL